MDRGGDRGEGGKGRKTAKIEKTWGNRSFWGVKTGKWYIVIFILK